MKNLLFLICIITFWACSSGGEGKPEPEPIPGEPKEYIVSLGLTGEIDIEESPLSKASGNDLYGVQVFQKAGNSYYPYAYGLFDDKNKMSIKLIEGAYYKFAITMIVNGKKVIYGSGNPHVYSFPFHTSISNNFIYDNQKELLVSSAGGDIYFDDTHENFGYPNIERFYGETEDYNLSMGETVSVYMKRVCFGVKFIVEGLTEGKLKINIHNAPPLTIYAGETEIQDIFAMYGFSTQINEETIITNNISVSVYWEKDNGDTLLLYDQIITFKRNVLTTITIKVKDGSTNNNTHSKIDINQESGEMTQGDNITMESGTGLGGNVKPVENQ